MKSKKKAFAYFVIPPNSCQRSERLFFSTLIWELNPEDALDEYI